MATPPLRVASLLALGAALSAQDSAPATRAESVSEYRMHAVLEPATRTLQGRQQIRWRNASRGSTRELLFHLYLNAFQGPDTTFFRTADPAFRALWRPGEFGGIDVRRLTLVRGPGANDRGVELVRAAIRPLDGNPADATVLRAELPDDVGPGESIWLETEFTVRFPKAYRRTGWVPDDGFFGMQWFPKLGVLEDADGGPVWKCHQFTFSSEFYADYSEYEVTLQVPQAYVVGATGGVPVLERAVGPDRELTFRASRVHDFAWVADPDFRLHVRRVPAFRAATDPTGMAARLARAMGVPVQDLDLPETTIRLLLQPEHDTAAQVVRHLDAVEHGLRHCGLRFGPYPYGVITVVDPGRDLRGRSLGGGMEYPMLITCGTDPWLRPRRLTPESVTLHEFTHQFWYGLVGNDEPHTAWIDEGLTTYTESRLATLAYGESVRPVRHSEFGLLALAAVAQPRDAPHGLASFGRIASFGSLPGAVAPWLVRHHFDGTWLPRTTLLDLLRAQPTLSYHREARLWPHLDDRATFLDRGSEYAIGLAAWEYPTRALYGVNAYQRPATLYWTLERMVGAERWWRFLREVQTRFRYRHVGDAEFGALLAESCGADAAAFFAAARRPGAVLDHGIAAVRPPHGFGPVKEVLVRRKGDLVAEVPIRFRFAKAGEVWRRFAPAEAAPVQRFVFRDGADGVDYGRLLEVWIDPPLDPRGHEGPPLPLGLHPLDADLTDNAWRTDRDRAPARHRGLRALLQAQAELSFAQWIG